VKQLKWIATLFWYGACANLVLTYSQNILVKRWGPHNFVQWMLLIKALIGLFLLVAFFVLIHFAVKTAIQYYPYKDADIPRADTPQKESADTPQTSLVGDPFPYGTTVVVGVWLLALTAFLAIGLFFILNSFCWPDWIHKCLEAAPDIANALATMFGAGIGSAIATILGYLEHASEKKDFDQAYSPWYVGRPLMGMLLGLVFYFLLRDGLLAIVTSKAEPADLSIAGLAGVGALVGLFSKEAIEKLRELFNTLFSTKKSVEQSILDRLPPGLKEEVSKYMSSTGAEKKNAI
jgi:hypothetical protein